MGEPAGGLAHPGSAGKLPQPVAIHAHPLLTPSIGNRIGADEDIARLGQDGMAEVYRARETGLDRDIGSVPVQSGPRGTPLETQGSPATHNRILLSLILLTLTAATAATAAPQRRKPGHRRPPPCRARPSRMRATTSIGSARL